MASVAGAGATMSTRTVFEMPPSGVETTTGTDDFAAAALPGAVSLVDDTKLVGSATPSNDTTEPATNPPPVTVSVKLPTKTGEGLTAVMLAAGMTVTAAVPLAVETAMLVARTVTVGGEGTIVGG